MIAAIIFGIVLLVVAFFGVCLCFMAGAMSDEERKRDGTQ